MMLNFEPVLPFCLKPKGLGYGNLKCIALRSAGFEFTQEGKPPRRIKQAVWADTSKYSGEQLRAIRAKKGVGRPPIEAQRNAFMSKSKAWNWRGPCGEPFQANISRIAA